MVTPEEQELIYERMAEAGIQNMGAYMRKMALNGYVLHVDLSDIRELVALQRRCANNLNQVAVHANTYGIYPSEIAALQKDYADLWEPLSELLKKLSRKGEEISRSYGKNRILTASKVSSIASIVSHIEND